MAEQPVRAARFVDLDPPTLYALLRLRVDVFVVEQECAYPELDGRDTEPGTVHLWVPDLGAAAPVAYARLLLDPDGTARIGRVCTARQARGRGLAARVVRHALHLAGDRPCALDAQSYLVGFYRGLGFTPAGPEYVEDGIPHVPMRREPGGRR
ncbi:MAG TPA: GNAT family N-acetyltransferase [Micromonosporaceae bacterium]|nr:GNAT family N-acetyltransferase [Micromonosporaceae bacterium]